MMKRFLLPAALLAALLFVAPAAAQTVANLLPDGYRWQPGGYVITPEIWAQRTSGLKICTVHIPASDPPQCRDTRYIWDSNNRITVNGQTIQCHNVADPDTCSTHRYVPAAQRSQASCTVVRAHLDSGLTDLRACAACANGSCDFFLGTGPISRTATATTTEPRPATTTPTATSSEPGGAPDGVPGGTPWSQGDDPDGDGDGCPDNFNLLPDDACTLDGLIRILIGLVVQIGTILLVLALVWTGFLFIQAQGNEEQLRSARSALLWTVLGGLLLLAAQALHMVISQAVSTL